MTSVTIPSLSSWCKWWHPTTNSHKSVLSPPPGAWGWALYPQAAGGAPLSIHKQLYVAERLVLLRLYFWTFHYNTKKTNYFRGHWFECCFFFQIPGHRGWSLLVISFFLAAKTQCTLDWDSWVLTDSTRGTLHLSIWMTMQQCKCFSSKF